MTIGIFTAMEKEARPFISDGATVEKVGDFTFYRFRLGNCDAVLCCPPYVGEIAAAAATQQLISVYHSDVIFNFGVAGALTEGVALRDFVYVRDVIHYEMDTSVVDGEPVGRYACFDGTAVKTNEFLLNKALSAKVFPLARCASGNKFVDSAADKTQLRDEFGAEICDMESAGVLFTCNFNRVPCLIVKCISDSLVGGYGEYRLTAQDACKEFLRVATLISDEL